MEINQQSIKIFSSKLYHLLNYTLPGFFTLEVFFKRGLFSNTPQTIYDFALLILWAFIFSIPFNFFSQITTKDVVKKGINKAKEKGLTVVAEDMKESKYQKRKFKKTDSLIQFTFVNLYLITSYIIFKYLTSHFIYERFWGINKMLLVYFNTVVVFYLLVYLPISIIVHFSLKIWLNQLLDKNHNS